MKERLALFETTINDPSNIGPLLKPKDSDNGQDPNPLNISLTSLDGSQIHGYKSETS
jgi:hypothetical protein